MTTISRPLTLLTCVGLLALVTQAADAATYQYRAYIPGLMGPMAPSTPAPTTLPPALSVLLAASGLPSGVVSQAYSYNLNALLQVTNAASYQSSDISWAVTGGQLPPGLQLSGGVLSGTPTTKADAGQSFDVAATLQGVSGSQHYTIVVNGLALEVLQISSGLSHSCALIPGGTVKCWGYNNVGQLGDGTTTDQYRPVTVQGLSDVASLRVGNGSTCALTNSGTVWCWGANVTGQLGRGTVGGYSGTPAPVTGLTNVASLSGKTIHYCALTSGGAAKCWGGNAMGGLGDGSTTDRGTAVQVTGLTSGVSALVAGHQYSCALTGSGFKCWGYNSYGQLGDGTTTSRPTPALVSVIGSQAVQAMSPGMYHACALLQSGAAYCWGSNSNGELGDGTTTSRLTPAPVIGLPAGVSSLKTGISHSCVTSASGVYCWGSNAYGELGTQVAGTGQPTPIPLIEAAGLTTVEPNWGDTCGLTSRRTAVCWGDNRWGKLGDGTTTSRNTPADVLP